MAPAGPAAAGAAGAAPTAEDLAEEGLTEYELARLEQVRRNQAKLAALGIPALLPFLKAVCQSKKSWQVGGWVCGGVGCGGWVGGAGNSWSGAVPAEMATVVGGWGAVGGSGGVGAVRR